MTLSVFVQLDRPYDSHGLPLFIKPAGFETDRKELWGTKPIRRRSELLFQISSDLFLPKSEFDEFCSQCLQVKAELKQIVLELVPNRRRTRDRRKALWLLRGIPRYLDNFIEAVDVARANGADQIEIS